MDLDKFDHDTFLFKLKDLGLELKVERISDTFKLTLNGLHFYTKQWEVFGYECNDTYNPCSRTKQTDFTREDIDKAIKESIIILSAEIEYRKYIPNYYSCKDYLKANCGKTKVEKESIERVFTLIKSNYNNIVRYMKSLKD